MKKKHLKFLKQLVETPSPTGFEEPAASLVRERLADVADEVAPDTMGSVRAVLEGRDAGAPSLMLAAHMDEIGLMVTYISDEGFLSVASLGGVDAAILPGMRVACTPLPAPSAASWAASPSTSSSRTSARR